MAPMPMLRMVACSALGAQVVAYLPPDAFEDSEDKFHRPLMILQAERADTEAEMRRLELPRLADTGPDTIRCTRLSDLEPTEVVWLAREGGVTDLHGVMASSFSIVVLKPRT